MSKLEQVAMAIGEVYDGYADPVETPENWARATAAARAAIEALREPDEAMKEFGVHAGVEGWDDYILEAHRGKLAEEVVPVIFNAMIDAILSETKP